MMKSYITHIMVSRKGATNYDKLAGLSQFDRLARVEQITGLEPAHPTWKDGMLPITSYLHDRYATVAPIHTVDSELNEFQNTNFGFFSSAIR